MTGLHAMSLTSHLKAAFAPEGCLRASINLGNPILARRDAQGDPCGVSVDLAHVFAQRLDVPLSLVVHDSAGDSVLTVSSGLADIGFFAIDPLRKDSLLFTAAYVLIEGSYLVRSDSRLAALPQVDQPGVRVVVGKGSAYDLYLTRTLRHASILRAPTSPAVVQTFLDEGAEVAAGVRQQLEADAIRHGGLRLLPGSFMTIRQAMAVPRRRGQEAAAELAEFVEDMKREGFVGRALKRHGIDGARVAPPAKPGPA